MASNMKFRIIRVHFRDREVDFEMERNLRKWEGNSRMFKRLLKAIKAKFQLKTKFHIYDPNDQMYVDDIDDLCGCYIGFENDPDFVLNLDIKAPKEPKKKAKSVKISTDKKSKSAEKRRNSIDNTLPSPKSKSKSNNNNNAKSSNTNNTNNINNNTNNGDTNSNGRVSSNGTRSSSKPQIPPLSTDSIANDLDHDDPERLDAVSPLTMEEIQPELQAERRRSRRLSIDFGVFNDKQRCEANTVWLDFGAARIKCCDMLTRCVHALKYYSNLELEHNVVDKDEFNNFFDDIYTTMLDDFLHLITFHNNDLEEIHNSLFRKYQFAPCDIKQCAFTKRHFAAKQRRSSSINEDPFIDLHIEMYDALHFWLFHLYDVGLRSTKKEIASDNASSLQMADDSKFEEEEDSEICVDHIWRRMVNRIGNKGKETAFLERYSKSRVRKYDLKETITSESRLIADCKKREALGQRLTFRDSLMVFAQKHCTGTRAAATLRRLYGFVSNEAYDSNAIMEDVVEEGNLSAVMKNKECLSVIRQYIRNRTLLTKSFSIGLVFYYWPYYRNCHQVLDDGGFTAAELSVDIKHATFKAEILNYGHVTITEYNRCIVLKARQYRKTWAAKRYKIRFNPHLHFDVERAEITTDHLIALILYTDFEELAKEFESTFRQIRYEMFPTKVVMKYHDPSYIIVVVGGGGYRLNESLQSIKARNQKFWWLSKTIREVVQYFGSNGSLVGQNVKGPFYVTMDRVIAVPEFNIRLCSPISTSMQPEVVTRFGESRGVLMQLNNNGDYKNARYLRSFNLSWIARHKEEDERLFIGGDWRIRIETVRVFKTGQNFKRFFDVLFLFDCMVGGADLDSPDAKSTEQGRPGSPTKKELSAALTRGPAAKPIDYHEVEREQKEREQREKEKEERLKREKKRRATVTGGSLAAFVASRAAGGDDDDGGNEGGMTPLSLGKKAKNGGKKRRGSVMSFVEEEEEMKEEEPLEPLTAIMEETESVSEHYRILKELIDHKLGERMRNKEERMKLPRYVIEAFDAFCRQKRMITLNLFFLHRNFGDLHPLIMTKIEPDLVSIMDTPWMPNPYIVKNVLQERLFTIFDNVSKLVIHSTKYDGFPSYSFSLMSLLSRVEFRSTFEEIVIKATWEEPTKADGKRSWIHKMWHASPLSAVKKMLAESDCKISIKKHKSNTEHWEDWIVIQRE